MDDERASLAAAIRLLVDLERHSLTWHPAPEELAAYQGGGLPPESELRLLNHVAICRECSGFLLDLAGFADPEPLGGTPELVEEIEQDWQKLRSCTWKEQSAPETAEVVRILPIGLLPKLERRYPLWLPVAASLLAVLGFSFGHHQSMQLEELVQPKASSVICRGAVEKGNYLLSGDCRWQGSFVPHSGRFD